MTEHLALLKRWSKWSDGCVFNRDSPALACILATVSSGKPFNVSRTLGIILLVIVRRFNKKKLARFLTANRETTIGLQRKKNTVTICLIESSINRQLVSDSETKRMVYKMGPVLQVVQRKKWQVNHNKEPTRTAIGI